MDKRKNFYKILVVGESASGKTSLIKMIHNWHKYIQPEAEVRQNSPDTTTDEHQDPYQMRLLDRMGNKQFDKSAGAWIISESAQQIDSKPSQNIHKAHQSPDEVLEKQDTALNSLSSTNHEHNSQKINANKAEQILDLSPLPNRADDNNMVCMRAANDVDGFSPNHSPADDEFQRPVPLLLEKRQRTTIEAKNECTDDILKTDMQIHGDLLPKMQKTRQSNLHLKDKNLTTNNTPRLNKINQKKSHLKYLNNNTDFTLKIMDIQGEKVRLQLWDQGQNRDPKTTFQPLYTRNVSACIVVANSSNPQSIKRAQVWKEQFDQTTKIKDEPAIPCTLFINHDKTCTKDTGSKMEIENQSNIKLNQNNAGNYQEQIRVNDQTTSPYTSNILWDDQTHLESLANTHKNGYFGVYHTALGEPESIKDSFENFVWRIIEDHQYTQRTYSVGSQFFDQFESRFLQTRAKSLSISCHTNPQYQTRQATSEKKIINPSVNMNLSDNESFKLQPLAQRRYGSNVDQEKNSCCNN